MLMSAPMVVYVNGGMLWGWERMKCRMVVLLSLSGGGTMVRLP